MLTAFCCAATMMAALPGEPPAPSVPQVRLSRLAKGINLSHWFAQSGTYADEHLNAYIDASDADLIAKAGFRHVRLTFEPEILWNWKSGPPRELNPRGIRQLNRAIRMFLDRKVAVIVDMHPSDDAFKLGLKSNPAHAENFGSFWGLLAAALKSYDPDWVFFETLNEPVIDDPDGWWAVQGTLVAKIRAAAPQHTVIVTPDEWSSIPRLERFKPYTDPNVVYNFHCYDPFLFTHQGATWGWELTRYMKNVPYPASPEAVAPILGAIENTAARGAVEAYARERWNATKMDANVARAAAWGKKHGVPLTCNEFGVYRAVSPPADRLACLADLRKACEKHGIGWCMWDYAGGFAVAVGDRGKRTLDAGTVRALGL